jgi:hypothetical protein
VHANLQCIYELESCSRSADEGAPSTGTKYSKYNRLVDIVNRLINGVESK